MIEAYLRRCHDSGDDLIWASIYFAYIISGVRLTLQRSNPRLSVLEAVKILRAVHHIIKSKEAVFYRVAQFIHSTLLHLHHERLCPTLQLLWFCHVGRWEKSAARMLNDAPYNRRGHANATIRKKLVVFAEPQSLNVKNKVLQSRSLLPLWIPGYSSIKKHPSSEQHGGPDMGLLRWYSRKWPVISCPTDEPVHNANITLGIEGHEMLPILTIPCPCTAVTRLRYDAAAIRKQKIEPDYCYKYS